MNNVFGKGFVAIIYVTLFNHNFNGIRMSRCKLQPMIHSISYWPLQKSTVPISTYCYTFLIRRMKNNEHILASLTKRNRSTYTSTYKLNWFRPNAIVRRPKGFHVMWYLAQSDTTKIIELYSNNISLQAIVHNATAHIIYWHSEKNTACRRKTECCSINH